MRREQLRGTLSSLLTMLWTLTRRVGQMLLLPFLTIGLLIGLVVVVLVLCWRAGVTGYSVTRRLTERRA